MGEQIYETSNLLSANRTASVHYMNVFNYFVRYKRKYQKNSRRYSLHTVKVKKTYGHIPDLQARILQKRLTSKGMPRRRSLRPDDPRRFGLLPLVPAPTIDELRQSQVRRGFGRWKTPVLFVFSRKK